METVTTTEWCTDTFPCGRVSPAWGRIRRIRYLGRFRWGERAVEPHYKGLFFFLSVTYNPLCNCVIDTS
jgi:hypothetical protein